MKCDELTPIDLECNMGKDINGVEHRETWKAYDIDEVKAAIAELKAELDELSFDKKLLEGHWESEKIRCEVASRNCFELSDENAKLLSKIESLKVGHRQGIANLKSYYKSKLEDAKATAYAESVDAGMRERRLKHALCLLKARYFWILMVYASDLAKVANPSIIHKSNFIANPTPRRMEEYQHEAELYDNARIKCLKKAEEYK